MGHQVVGVFVANREACGGDEVARIRSEFEVEDFISYDRHRPRNQAMLTVLALNPIFAGHCRFALKEVSCLSCKDVVRHVLLECRCSLEESVTNVVNFDHVHSHLDLADFDYRMFRGLPDRGLLLT